MTRRMTIGLAALAVGATPALAQEPEPLKLEGLYLFHTYAQQDGRPVCMEAWDFAADGVMRVESGQERVLKRYRIERDRDGVSIVSETLETNGAPDCMGHAAAGVTPGEVRTYVVPANDGTIEVCPAPQRMADGAPYVSGCYGRIVLASEAG